MADGLAAARALNPPPDVRGARRVLYRHRGEAYGDGVRLAFAWGGARTDDPAWRALGTLAERWTPPAFPLSGRDVVGGGRSPGPAVGDILRTVEAWWIDQDFAPDAAALRQRLQQLLAEQ
jgi:hypothetical protein